MVVGKDSIAAALAGAYVKRCVSHVAGVGVGDATRSGRAADEYAKFGKMITVDVTWVIHRGRREIRAAECSHAEFSGAIVPGPPDLGSVDSARAGQVVADGKVIYGHATCPPYHDAISRREVLQGLIGGTRVACRPVAAIDNYSIPVHSPDVQAGCGDPDAGAVRPVVLVINTRPDKYPVARACGVHG